jgi:hypothetical protein
MSDDVAARLTAEYVRTATPSALLADIRGWMQAAQRPSLIHPHGFCVLLLHRTEREEWRFHVWPQGMRLISGVPGPIHTHDKVVGQQSSEGRADECRLFGRGGADRRIARL